jgi:TonB-linked SusC/RagA family outer membrane protein
MLVTFQAGCKVIQQNRVTTLQFFTHNFKIMKCNAHRKNYLKRGILTKTLLVMKLTIILTFAACLQVSAKGIAQEQITLSEKNASLEKVLTSIKAQTGYTFFYMTELMEQAKTVSIDVKNASLKQVLELCFKDQPLNYQIVDKAITITVKKKEDEVNYVSPPLRISVKGKIVDEKGIPIAGVNISVKGTKKAALTDEFGVFTINDVEGTALLLVNHIGYETKEFQLENRADVAFSLTGKTNELQQIEIYNTGYQSIPKERSTGSFTQINVELLNRSTSNNLLERLKGVTNGLSPARATGPNPLGINIRGLSTINSTAAPLIVIDNFPYDGDITNINPNDVENVTILKDAAAASIWGVNAGNGVIVITTKKGKYNQSAKITANTNITIGENVNLFYAPTISSPEYIDLEQFLYEKGFYNSRINSAAKVALDPVQEILVKKSNNQLSAAEAATQLNALKSIDIRNDAAKYLFQKSVSQQYAINLSGGSPISQYYVSGGLDKSRSVIKRNEFQRISINANNTYSLYRNNLQITTEVSYLNSKTENNGLSVPAFSKGGLSYPYAKLADADGIPLPIAQYRQGYIDTAGGGKLLDWNYRPLEELILADNTNSQNEFRLNIGLRYRFPKGFAAEIKYQYGQRQIAQRILQEQQTFYARDQINLYTNINRATGTITNNIPLGGILDMSNLTVIYKNFRSQITYNNYWNGEHQLNLLLGTEVRDANGNSSGNRLYGYDPLHATSIPADFVNSYSNYITGATQRISNGQQSGSTEDRFLSYFGNLAYTFKDKYTLTTSARRDGANIFGANINQKIIPLWSAGLSWTANRESFYHIAWLPSLKARLTFGYQGNVNKGTSAVLTTLSGFPNSFGIPSSLVGNLPNPELRWEKVSQINYGIDFGLKNEIVTGSIEYFTKNAQDLMAASPLTPSSGISQFVGNSANMKGNGVDIILNTKNTKGKIQWSSTFIFNYITNRITNYFTKASNNQAYVSSGYSINPVVGNPLYSLYSYQWAGLDTSGNPQGILNDKVSKDYTSIENSSNISELKFNGSLTPRFVGSFRNSITYKRMSISCNITYKLGYVFRRASVNYYNLFNTGYQSATGDYANRWQAPGDERKTTIPSLVYPLSSSIRDLFYNGSDVLVEKGDHIRFQDIRIVYSFIKKTGSKMPFEKIDLYAYINNLGILWKANKYKIDPDVIPTNGSYLSFPNPTTYSVGLRIEW